MVKKKLDFDIFYEGLEDKQKEWDYIIKFAEVSDHNKIRELREIVIEILEPEQRFLTST